MQVLVEKRESIRRAAISLNFVFFPISQVTYPAPSSSLFDDIARHAFYLCHPPYQKNVLNLPFLLSPTSHTTYYFIKQELSLI